MKFLFFFMLLVAFCGQVFASDEAKREKIKENINDSKRAAKQESRNFEDRTCELVNGKMTCALKKVKHSAEKRADQIKDAAD
jgi:hypothetical protein